jgi:hypothetical protein
MRAAAVLSCVWPALALASAGAAADCPYKVFAWITHDDSNPSYYTSFDWTCIGSVGFFGDLETITGLKDYAHERGVKLSKVERKLLSDLFSHTAGHLYERRHDQCHASSRIY